MKKLVSLTLTLLMILGALLVFPANAEEKEQKQADIAGGTLSYTELEDGTICIDKFTGSGETTDITLPDEIDGKTVTEIGKAAFKNAVIEKLTLPSRLTSISEYGVCGKKIKAIELPETLEELGKYALRGCKKLQSIDLSHVKKLGEGALLGCSELKSVKLSDELTEIGNEAFAFCKSLEEINIPKSVKSIGFSLFYGYHNRIMAFVVDSDNPYFTSADGVLFNKKMTELVIYPSGKAAKDYHIPDTVSKVRAHAFDCVDNLEKLTLSKNLRSIETDAVTCCDKLRTIDFGDGLQSWTTRFFADCGQISKIVIGENLSTIAAEKIYSYASCDTTVCEFVVRSSNKTYASKNGILYSKNMKRIVRYPSMKNSKSYKSPSTVRVIEPYAFFGTHYLAKVTLNDKITEIGKGAFKSSSLKEGINIPKALTKISDYCFRNCGLKSITIPKNIKTIGRNAFSVQEFVVSSSNKTYASKNGVLFSKNMKRIVLYPSMNKSKSYKTPSTVRAIEPYAFYGTHSLAKVTLNGRISKIGKGAFQSSSLNEGINIPKALTEISDYCFQNCGLKSIVIPKNIKIIGRNAFNGCDKLSKVVLREGIKTVKDEAFLYCNKFAGVTIPKSVKKIGEHAFGYRDYLRADFEDGNAGEPVHRYVLRHSYTIKGYKGTEAQRYAKANEITFKIIK